MKSQKNKRKPIEMTKSLSKLNEARDLIYEAKELIDGVLKQPEVKDFQFVSHYYAYGRYGINQLLGEGNPYDDGLHSLIEEIEKEGL